MKRSKITFGIIRLIIDFLLIIAALTSAYYLRSVTDLIPGVQYEFLPEMLPDFGEYQFFTLWASLFLILIFIINDLYSLKRRLHPGKTFLKIAFSVSAWLLFIIAFYSLVIHQLFFSRIALAHIWLLSILFVSAGRMTLGLIERFLLKYGIGQRRVAFVGISPFGETCYAQLKNNPHYKIMGTIFDKNLPIAKTSLKILGSIQNLENIVKKNHIEEIIQVAANSKGIRSSELLHFCRSHQVNYYFSPDTFQLASANVEMEMIDGLPLIHLKRTPLEGWGYVIKRLFDFMASLILILLLIPIWFLFAILIKLDSKGPVIFKSRRKHGEKIFNAYKFRSMVKNADHLKAKLMEKNERNGPLFKIKNDPRVTRMGKFLRKTSLDELPQLFNVLLGHMSLAGPRPHLPEEVLQYQSHHHQLFTIKPGLTGLAQISGRSHLDFEEEVKLDFYYIENWSLLLDLKIFFKSIGVIFRADGH